MVSGNPPNAPTAPENPSNNSERLSRITNSSFFKKRWEAVKGGGKDIGSTLWDTFKEYTIVDRSKGSPSILGIIKDTSKAVWETISWKKRRGLLNLRGLSINPFNKEKEFVFNPMVAIRKITAGTTLAVSKVLGGTIGLASDRIGNAAEGLINAGSRGIGGAVLGDYGQYLH